MVSEAGPQAVELAEAAAEGMDRERSAGARRAARLAFEEAMMDYDEEVGYLGMYLCVPHLLMCRCMHPALNQNRITMMKMARVMTRAMMTMMRMMRKMTVVGHYSGHTCALCVCVC